MIGHLSGPRVSALLDGQLSAREVEEAWAHAHQCHPCRDLVEREGWVKTRLAGWSAAGADPAAPSALKGSLLSLTPEVPVGPAFAPPSRARAESERRANGVALVGGGALGAAVLGVLALGVAPGAAPDVDRRPPVTQIGGVLPGQNPSPAPGPRPALTTPTPAPGPGSPAAPSASDVGVGATLMILLQTPLSTPHGAPTR